MNRTYFLALLVVVPTWFAGQSFAAAERNSPSNHQPAILKLSDLRSAYLLRSGVVHYDSAAMSPDGIRRQLQRHFDVVLGMLVVATRQSIETALDRLQANSEEVWSAKERNRWRKRLLKSRYIQLTRLAMYRDRGRFPQNEGQSSVPVPIFIDRHETACAVGYLMQLSGWWSSVSRIRNSDNLVYASDASDSSLANWVSTSGLTLEEAALIQPAYFPPVEFEMKDFGPGTEPLVRNGLKFENFVFHAEDSGPPIGEVPTVEQVAFGVGERPGLIGTHWIAFGGVDYTTGAVRFIEGYAESGVTERIVFRFDVSTTEPGSAINQLTQHLWRYYFEPPDEDPILSMKSRALINDDEIASTYLDMPSDACCSTVDFLPRSHLTVETELTMENNVGINSFLLDFNVVSIPEPCSNFLWILGLAILNASARNRRNGSLWVLISGPTCGRRNR